jgi:hypothetical protein
MGKTLKENPETLSFEVHESAALRLPYTGTGVTIAHGGNSGW